MMMISLHPLHIHTHILEYVYGNRHDLYNGNVLTSIVCDWCIVLMADRAICLAVNVTNAQPVGKRHHTYYRLMRHSNVLHIHRKDRPQRKASNTMARKQTKNMTCYLQNYTK